MRALQKQKIILSFLTIYSLTHFLSCSSSKTIIKESNNLETLKDSSFLNQPLKERTTSFRSLKGIAHISLKTKKNTKSFNMAVVLKNPDLLRFEVLSPLGQTMAVITSNGKNICYTNLKESRIFITPLTKSTSEKFLGLPFLPQELIEIMTANIPVGDTELGEIQFDKDNNFYILNIAQNFSNVTKKYYIDHIQFIPLKLEASDQNGYPLYEVNYSDYRNINNYNLPQKITCNYYLNNITVKINFKELSMNGVISESLFTLQNYSDFEMIYSE